MKTYGIENIFRSAFTCIPGMKEAYVYGSYARGEMDPHSDIDVLAIGDHSVIETGRKVAKLQKELGREINVVNMSVPEYEGRIKKKDAFIMDVKKNRKIRLI
jgi:predicted nucleotidyltransferase